MSDKTATRAIAVAAGQILELTSLAPDIVQAVLAGNDLDGVLQAVLELVTPIRQLDHVPPDVRRVDAGVRETGVADAGGGRPMAKQTGGVVFRVKVDGRPPERIADGEAPAVRQSSRHEHGIAAEIGV